MKTINNLTPRRGECFAVCYKNWRGQWVRDGKRFNRNSTSAQLRLAFIKSAAAENGVATLQLVPERSTK